MSLLIRIPFAAIIVFLLIKTKIFKAFSPKKKTISVILTALISLSFISAVPFDYYLFRFNSPKAAISYSLTEPKLFDVAGIIHNSDVGDYVVINTRTWYEAYYLEKEDQKWKMVKPNIQYDIKKTGWEDSAITYRHYIEERIVAVEIYFSFTNKSSSDYQVSDNKGTVFQSYTSEANLGYEKRILFCGLYAFDDLPYELYVNGELVFTYNESQE